mmetsp:Transcript_3095/g.9055  ORF Transcript_3095/g.9055 Transcript_3095/m.9055 type:complete len:200 (+) Transcript_3095:220-819(+)|eukprot:CAMPEP_0119276186 /NCGR_PEP_ID=MMETSP1329-20130426/14993_1 /TAXON_ID=114041 /ORGANISM="Genus nov. species nov., Strain RCC1024" /LENGTH=199 /DNA_ID=CAMNT_0007276613 /DNA_START=167 /DNA_END=763 /DNA_ORIENTATION=-
MGNSNVKGTKSLYIAAMANVTGVERKELNGMRAKFAEAAKASGGNPNSVSKDEFSRAIDELGISPQDVEILDRLFTMFDKMGDGRINYREFIVGVSPLARGDVADKLRLAFELYDVDGAGHVKASEMCFVLNAMNNVATWFGDPGLTPDEIDKLVEDVFAAAGGELSLAYADNIFPVAEHELARVFLSGSGSVLYGAGP